MKKILTYGTFLVLLFGACTVPMKTFSEMNPKERAAWMLSVYNDEFALYQAALGYELVGDKWTKTRDVVLTEKQVEFYSNKKALLKNVYPLIKTYAAYVKSGSLPSEVIEEQITKQLNELLMKQLE